MKKAIGFNLGQYGDLCVNVVVAKAFKLQYPDYELTFHIGKPYEAIKEIFYFNKYIDKIHVSDGYDNWPTEKDNKFFNQNQFDIIYDPKIAVKPGWQLRGHHALELCNVHNLTPPDSLQIELNNYFVTPQEYKKYIAICYKGTTDSDKKSITDKNLLIEICNIIKSYGFEPLFFQEDFLNYITVKDTFFDAIKIMLGCKMLITIDSAMAWIASGYQFPVLGLYNKNYYKEAGVTTSLNWQPINPNAIYLEDEHVNLINIDKIKNSVENILL
jgi:ADP-heptose:LPS heptosyltransferase